MGFLWVLYRVNVTMLPKAEPLGRRSARFICSTASIRVSPTGFFVGKLGDRGEEATNQLPNAIVHPITRCVSCPAKHLGCGVPNPLRSA